MYVMIVVMIVVIEALTGRAATCLARAWLGARVGLGTRSPPDSSSNNNLYKYLYSNITVY